MSVEEKIIRFQHFRCKELRIDNLTDSYNITHSWGETNIVPLDPNAQTEFMWGEFDIQEGLDQPVKSIRAKIGSKLCILHAPKTSYEFKNFYVKHIVVKTDNIIDMNAGDLAPVSLEQLARTVWTMRFRFTAIEILAAKKRTSMLTILDDRKSFESEYKLEYYHTDNKTNNKKNTKKQLKKAKY